MQVCLRSIFLNVFCCSCLLLFKFSLLLLVFYGLSPVSLLLLPCLLNEKCNLLLLQFRVRCIRCICQLFFAAVAVAAAAVAALAVAPYLRRQTSRGWRRSPARSTSPPCRTGNRDTEIEVTVHVSFTLPEGHFAQWNIFLEHGRSRMSNCLCTSFQTKVFFPFHRTVSQYPL